jgi:hypothetical protein
MTLIFMTTMSTAIRMILGIMETLTVAMMATMDSSREAKITTLTGTSRMVTTVEGEIYGSLSESRDKSSPRGCADSNLMLLSFWHLSCLSSSLARSAAGRKDEAERAGDLVPS